MTTLGVCYYPDHWPRERWADDARAMADLGIRRVRVGEFAWALLEPEPGRFAFGWLDEAIDALAAAGLAVILGTPTATPPKWLIDRHPEILPVGADGRVRGFGSRRHYCFRSPDYRRETERIVEALAERYGGREGVVAWQTDNEYGCHDTTRCWCDACRTAFRDWLRERYGTVDALNDAWWTGFWSQRYREFGEVELPEQAVTESNPGHRLDFYRFASDGVIAYDRLQRETIRRHSDLPIAHNSMMLFGDYDHVDLAAELDAIAFDNYPLGQLEESPLPSEVKELYLRVGHPDLVSLSHDLYRGLKGRPHWVMEQQPGPVNWARSNPLPADGAVRLWTLQGAAHGAEMVSWFRWRAAVGAQETMHAGLLRHDGSRDRAYAEGEQVARELGPPPDRDVFDALADASGAPDARVAILFDYEDLWAAEIQPHAAAFGYWHAILAFYAPLRGLGLDVDLVPKKLAGRPPEEGGRDLSRYRLVVAPAMQLADDRVTARLSAYVEAGGRLLLGPRSGTRTNTMLAQPAAPGPLRSLVGVRVDRVDGLRSGVHRTLTPAEDGRPLHYGVWADLLEPGEGTRILASYDDPAYRGAAAYTARPHGDGEARVLGALLEPDAMAALLAPWLGDLGLDPTPLPEGVRRSGAWLLNFMDHEAHAYGAAVPAHGAVRLARSAEGGGAEG
jgi:beta-galactosidase